MILSDLSDPRAYDELLSLLRRDLQLDLATDVVAGSQASLLHLGIARGAGVAPIPWPGASSLSSQLTIKHGLGVTPSSVILTPVGAFTSNPPLVYEYAIPDATNLYVQAWDPSGFQPAAGNTWGNYHWVALI